MIWTKDDEGNYFSISSTGEVIGKIAVSFNVGDEDEINVDRLNTPDFPDGDFIEEENKFLPPPE